MGAYSKNILCEFIATTITNFNVCHRANILIYECMNIISCNALFWDVVE